MPAPRSLRRPGHPAPARALSGPVAAVVPAGIAVGLAVVAVVAAVCGAGCGRIGFDGALSASDAAGDAPGDAPGDVVAGLVARYAFDGDVTRDSQGAHDAVCVNGCPAVEPDGVVGDALSMDGGAAHLRVIDDGGLETLLFTVAGWVRYRGIAARTCIFTKLLEGQANSWALCTEDDGRPFLFACEACDSVRSPDPIEVDAWVHLAGSYDGAVKRLYVDGVEVARADGGVTFNAAAVVIGGDDDGAFGFATDGLIDELRIYDRALSDAEIALLAGR